MSEVKELIESIKRFLEETDENLKELLKAKSTKHFVNTLEDIIYQRTGAWYKKEYASDDEADYVVIFSDGTAINVFKKKIKIFRNENEAEKYINEYNLKCVYEDKED